QGGAKFKRPRPRIVGNGELQRIGAPFTYGNQDVAHRAPIKHADHAYLAESGGALPADGDRVSGAALGWRDNDGGRNAIGDFGMDNGRGIARRFGRYFPFWYNTRRQLVGGWGKGGHRHGRRGALNCPNVTN